MIFTQIEVSFNDLLKNFFGDHQVVRLAVEPGLMYAVGVHHNCIVHFNENVVTAFHTRFGYMVKDYVTEGEPKNAMQAAEAAANAVDLMFPTPFKSGVYEMEIPLGILNAFLMAHHRCDLDGDRTLQGFSGLGAKGLGARFKLTRNFLTGGLIVSEKAEGQTMQEKKYVEVTTEHFLKALISLFNAGTI